MKTSQTLLITLGVVVAVGVGGYLWTVAWPQGTNSQNTNSANTNAPLDIANANTTGRTDLVSAVTMTGRQVQYSTAFGQPQTSSWPEHCLADTVCFRYNPAYAACASTVGTETAYLLEDEPCEGSQDAPAFVVQRIPPDPQTAPIEPAYTFDFREQVAPDLQVESDEIVGEVSGRKLTCYNTKYDRVCKVTYPDGQEYSLDGRGYNSASGEELTTIRSTFDAMVRTMLEG
ncbi:MAG: hypothetical protein HYY50_03270 [Candidatus Kerfeldbacteria bacterium]|nr:hypothetical protein [Candidatus Kerfeldbacteria bacterium]